MALAVQGLGFLESGITDPLNQFSNTLLEFSSLLKKNVRRFASYLPQKPKLKRTMFFGF
jgi:hypothetical protein